MPMVWVVLSDQPVEPLLLPRVISATSPVWHHRSCWLTGPVTRLSAVPALAEQLPQDWVPCFQSYSSQSDVVAVASPAS